VPAHYDLLVGGDDMDARAAFWVPMHMASVELAAESSCMPSQAIRARTARRIAGSGSPIRRRVCSNGTWGVGKLSQTFSAHGEQFRLGDMR
jgi:hypothetical protein